MNLHSQFKNALQTLASLQSSDTSYEVVKNSVFATWNLVQINDPMKTKLGLAFDKDEISIAKPEHQFGVDMFGYPLEKLVVWSFKKQRVVLVQIQHNSKLEGESSEINIM